MFSQSVWKRPEASVFDEIRLSRAALPKEQLILVEGTPPAAAIVGHWTFEAEPGFFKEVANRVEPLGRPMLPKTPGVASETGLVDFCHVLLNSNEFLYVD